MIDKKNKKNSLEQFEEDFSQQEAREIFYFKNLNYYDSKDNLKKKKFFVYFVVAIFITCRRCSKVFFSNN